jgi:hypothetical protein
MKGNISVLGQSIELSDVPSKRFEVVDQALVDDEQWYTLVTGSRECAQWIRTHDSTRQYEHPGRHVIGYIFDVHEQLYILLGLKWKK